MTLALPKKMFIQVLAKILYQLYGQIRNGSEDIDEKW